MPSVDIDALFDDDDAELFTEVTFRRRRAHLVSQFLMTYSVHEDEIDDLVYKGELHQTALGDDWISLHALGHAVGVVPLHKVQPGI